VLNDHRRKAVTLQHARRCRPRPLHAASYPPGILRFLNTVERALLAGKLVHASLDNYATHKHPQVNAWLARHPRWGLSLHPHLRVLAQCG
jgi:hypothetical protein